VQVIFSFFSNVILSQLSAESTTAAPGPITTTAAPGPITTTAAPLPITTTAAPLPITTTAAPAPITTPKPIICEYEVFKSYGSFNEPDITKSNLELS